MLLNLFLVRNLALSINFTKNIDYVSDSFSWKHKINSSLLFLECLAKYKRRHDICCTVSVNNNNDNNSNNKKW